MSIQQSIHRSIPTTAETCSLYARILVCQLEDWSVQDLKIAKRTSKDLFFDPGPITRFFKINSLEFLCQAYLIPLTPD